MRQFCIKDRITGERLTVWKPYTDYTEVQKYQREYFSDMSTYISTIAENETYESSDDDDER